MLSRKSFSLFGLTLALIASPVHAADWIVRTDQSKLGFIALQAGAEFEGRFRTFRSDISFDENDLARSRVNIEIDISSVDTENADRDRSIVSKEWFDVATHPKALFETVSIKPDGKGAYVADARLTMRGITKAVKLPFKVDISGDQATAAGELSVNRLDFAIGQGQWAATTVVGDKVRIFFDLVSDAK